SDQCETGTATSAGLVVARTRTWWRSSGGKSPRPAAPREVTQTHEAVAGEAGPPACHGVGGTVVFVGDAEGGGGVRLGGAQDETRAEGEALGGEAGVGNLVEAVVFVGAEGDAACFAGHARASVLAGKRNTGDSRQGSPRATGNQGVIRTRMFTLNP